MALSSADRKRLKELGAEVKEILGGSRHTDGRAKTFDELEEDSIKVGDFFSAAMLEANVREANEPMQVCPCPTCDRPSGLLEGMDPRVLETDRGPVSWEEAEYFCRKCRRSFFPSNS